MHHCENFNIPEAVTGGLLAALITLILYLVFNIQVSFSMELRDVLLVYFFSAIGLNTKIKELLTGGKPMMLLLVSTLVFMVLQNSVGIGLASALDLNPAVGLLTGSVSLIGGHGTSIAWAPVFQSSHEVKSALEIGIASATLGLVVASVLGGPIAMLLIKRHALKSSKNEELTVGIAYSDEGSSTVNHVNLIRTILMLHVCIIFGYGLKVLTAEVGLRFPLFVTCLVVGMALTNSVDKLLPNLWWPSKSRALSLVSDLSISLFICISLMAMELWSIAELAGPLLILLVVQALTTTAFVCFVVFRLLGSNYQAAVIAAGFTGYSLGSTPTAIANMTAVAKANGAAPQAFLIVPMVCAFFVSISNAFIIQIFLSLV